MLNLATVLYPHPDQNNMKFKNTLLCTNYSLLFFSKYFIRILIISYTFIIIHSKSIRIYIVQNLLSITVNLHLIFLCAQICLLNSLLFNYNTILNFIFTQTTWVIYSLNPFVSRSFTLISVGFLCMVRELWNHSYFISMTCTYYYTVSQSH